jgi:NADH:ubiquinone oxidoreductase subunit 5 (subunit L)/multisubunit Na+/H+ antiporter MnhA subunit
LLFKIKTSLFGKKIYNFLNRKWFFDKIYNEYFGQFFFKFGYSISYKFIDRGIFEILGPTGLSITALKVGSNLHKMQTGFIYHYTLIILIGATLIFSIRQFWLIFGFFVDYRCFILIFILLFFVVNSVEKK